MTVGGKPKLHNRLWLARKRRGLSQKQVAYLLGHHTVDQVSRYEKGLRLPSLEIALRLAIIYRTPLRYLFADLSAQFRDELRHKIESSGSFKHLKEEGQSQPMSPSEFCSYQDLMLMPSASQADLARVRQHVIYLTRTMAYL